jgi:cytochrome P450
MFSESANCMEHDASHEWLSNTTSLPHGRVVMAGVKYYPWPANVVGKRFIPRRMLEAQKYLFSHTVKYVHKRLDTEADLADFMSPLIHAYRCGKINLSDIEASAMVLIVAGSETGAIQMLSTLQNIMQRPDKLAKLTREIRAMYTSAEQITLGSLDSLPYLKAILQENFRMNPPLAMQAPRLALRQGGMVCREFIPGGVRLLVYLL